MRWILLAQLRPYTRQSGHRIHGLTLANVNLTGWINPLPLNVINVAAEFEWEFLIECTEAGLCRTKAGGNMPGNSHRLSADQCEAKHRSVGGVEKGHQKLQEIISIESKN